MDGLLILWFGARRLSVRNARQMYEGPQSLGTVHVQVVHVVRCLEEGVLAERLTILCMSMVGIELVVSDDPEV